MSFSRVRETHHDGSEQFMVRLAHPTPMSDFVAVCQVSDIPDPGKQVFEIEDRFVVVFHVDGSFYALDDECTHDGGPLGDGKLNGFQITCPRHGAKFDIRDGRVLSMPAVRSTAAHEVKVEGNTLYVRLKE
jgi:3-phenylpropionate/trans-cinnamate dioxygenase ferredoxin component